SPPGSVVPPPPAPAPLGSDESDGVEYVPARAAIRARDGNCCRRRQAARRVRPPKRSERHSNRISQPLAARKELSARNRRTGRLRPILVFRPPPVKFGG